MNFPRLFEVMGILKYFMQWKVFYTSCYSELFRGEGKKSVYLDVPKDTTLKVGWVLITLEYKFSKKILILL